MERRARAARDAGRLDEAVALFREALSLGDDAATHVELARVLEQRGDARGAADEYRAALAKDSRSAAAARTWYELGRLSRTALHDPRGAEKALRKATELEPSLPEAHFALGTVLIELGDPEGGSAEVQAALSLAPADVAWRQDAENALVLAHLKQRERGEKR